MLLNVIGHRSRATGTIAICFENAGGPRPSLGGDGASLRSRTLYSETPQPRRRITSAGPSSSSPRRKAPGGPDVVCS
eukprot:1745202-Pyramimonas_sp.AAC.1